MAARYRVALLGFSDFEHETLASCFRLTAEREPSYLVTPMPADADFLVADADHDRLIESVSALRRVPHTVFIGLLAPLGATAHLQRPIDPSNILKALDELAERRRTAPDEPVEILPPSGFRDSIEFPELDQPVTELPVLQVPVLNEPVPSEPVVASRVPPRIAPAAAPAPSHPLPAEPPRPHVPDMRSPAKAAARAAARRARQAQIGATAQHRGADVLLLDDSDIARRFLEHLLEGFGFRVHGCADGAQARKLIGEQSFVAAFVDVVLGAGDPDDGLVICRHIKALAPNGHPVPAVVMVTGQSVASDQVRARLAGCDAFLTKPVTRGDVARTLEACGVMLPNDARRR